MASNLPPAARALPLYIDGVHDGTDIGLVIALGYVVAAGTDQERARPPDRPAQPRVHALRVGAAGGGRPGSGRVP